MLVLAHRRVKASVSLDILPCDFKGDRQRRMVASDQQGPAHAYFKRKHYQHLLEPRQRELASVARWVRETGQRLVNLFEGRDMTGKGRRLSPLKTTLRNNGPTLNS